VNYLPARAYGARKGYFVVCFAGTARKTHNKIIEEAREVGQAQEKTHHLQTLIIWISVIATIAIAEISISIVY
jgi:hypothetical protein